MTTWTKLTFTNSTTSGAEDSQEGLSCELVAQGALGTTVEADGSVTCFCETTQSTISLMRSLADQWGFATASEEVLEQQNWNRQCAELWEPFTRGIITVVPVESSNDTTSLPDRHIKIIPGLGFGTGHHPTTNMILGVLSDLSQQHFQPRSVFDLGTGSGILAIAAAKLFGAPIVANDIDPHAIENAEENSSLNHTTNLISYTTAATSEIDGSFDLIIANVYGEVLVQLAPEVTRLASTPCTLILSGISELVRDSVVDAYTGELHWNLSEELSEGGWVCLVLQRA